MSALETRLNSRLGLAAACLVKMMHNRSQEARERCSVQRKRVLGLRLEAFLVQVHGNASLLNRKGCVYYRYRGRTLPLQTGLCSTTIRSLAYILSGWKIGLSFA
jgi:hypothetical protein